MERKKTWKEGWVSILIQVGIIVFSVGVCYATAYSKIDNLEKRIDAREVDHDILITLVQKVDSIASTVNEIKKDLKNHILK